MNSIADEKTDHTSENILTAFGTLDVTKGRTTLQLPDGRTLRLRTAMLLEEEESKSDVEPTFSANGALKAIPVIEERLEVSKRTVTTGKVILEKHLQTYQESVDVPLAIRTFDIERVVLNQVVETAPAIRHEGMTTIYPLVEEQVVVTTQLLLKEELRVTQRDTERLDHHTVTLQREFITVARSSA